MPSSYSDLKSLQRLLAVKRWKNVRYKRQR